MTTSTIIWIIVAVIVVIAFIAFVTSRSRGRQVEAKRDRAAEIRQEAAEHDQKLREREVNATEAQARSELARAEAEKRRLEAERLEAEAREHSGDAEAVRRERDERMRLADLHDPDVRTDKEGHRIDEDGNRLDETGDGEGLPRQHLGEHQVGEREMTERYDGTGVREETDGVTRDR